jgi:phosphatidylserine decarboxylase
MIMGCTDNARPVVQAGDPMTVRSVIMKIALQEDVNFWLTNRLPRRTVTGFMGWLSKIEHPWVCATSIRIWRFFADLDLRDAKETSFRSLHHCFTRQLKAGARPTDMRPDILASPCDGIVGACGTIAGDQLLQVKGSAYSLTELLGDAEHAGIFRNGRYMTLRLTSAMYHRFHAPQDCCVEAVTHIAGDAWNVNPIALRRVAKLYCKNERAIIRTKLSAGGQAVTLIPVAAILVAGIRLQFLDLSRARTEKTRRTFPSNVMLRKGEEMGWFEHGSTIIVLAPEGCEIYEGLTEGTAVRAGQAIMRTGER